MCCEYQIQFQNGQVSDPLERNPNTMLALVHGPIFLQVLSENKKLKRQSQLLLDKVSAGDIKITEINFEDEPSDTTNNNESQIEHLQAMMEGKWCFYAKILTR